MTERIESWSKHGQAWNQSIDDIIAVRKDFANLVKAASPDEIALVPSVSAILAMEAKPALENWKVDQALLAAVTLPRQPDETDDLFIIRAKEDSREQARKARERGTAIHAAIQGAFEGKPVTAEDLPYVEPVQRWLSELYGVTTGETESSFASPLGYGGKADFLHREIPLVLDYKCKDFDEDKDAKELAWPEHAMQLAAYRQGFEVPDADCVNVFVSTSEPGLIRLRKWEGDELAENWEAFLCLLKLYKIRKHFDPSFTRELL